MLRALAILSLLVISGRELRSQYVDLREGGRIRIRTVAHPKWLYARFVSFDTSGLRLTQCDSCDIQRLPLPQLRTFQASTGRTGRSFALEGALLGAIVGAVWGRQTAIHQPEPTSDLACTGHCGNVTATVQGALVGTVVGTTVGAFLRRVHWETIPLAGSQPERR